MSGEKPPASEMGTTGQMQVTANKMMAVRQPAPRTLMTGVKFRAAEPAADTFTRALPKPEEKPQITDQSAKPAPVKALKALLQEAPFAQRKQNAALFLEQATGIKPFGVLNGLTDSGNMTEAKKDEVRALADQVKAMQPVQKVDLMKQVMGPDSPFVKLAEMNLNQEPVTMRDMFKTFKQPLRSPDSPGITATIGAVGMGLLLMPIVAPVAIFNPQIAGAMLANLGLLLV